MARRRGNGGATPGSLALVAFGWVLLKATATVAVYLPPLALTFALLYYEFRARFARKNLSLEDAARRYQVRGKIRQRLDQIEIEGSHLKMNVDGTYHRGSKLGMKLNAEIEVLTERSYQIRRTISRWTRIISLRNALRVTVPAYLAIALGAYIITTWTK